MACILEIRKTIQKSIDEKLFLSKDVGIVKRGAEKIRDYLNDLWDSPIAVVKRHKFNSNAYVVEIKSLDAAVNKEFKKQLAAEKSFKRDLAFFNNDSRLFIQEDKEEVGPFNYTSNEEITNAIKKQLPVEISNTVTVIQDVPLDILGREDLFLSLKEILNDNNVKDEILINWAGVNKDAINIKSIKSEQQLEKIINSVYNKKKDVNSHPELKINKLALESFDKWVNALEKFPIAFKEVMLTHAIKQLNPKRRSKYVLQLSDVALTQAYGIVVNKPHELNRIGKLYDQEVLKTVSDAIGHEPSESGKGYWVHIPRTSSGKLLKFDNYKDFKEDYEKQIKSLTEEIKRQDKILDKPPVFKSQEPTLDRKDANKYGFQEYTYVRVESTYSRWDKNKKPILILRNQPHIEKLGEDYEGYYIHGYNTEQGKPETKIVPITKEQAKELWQKDIDEKPNKLGNGYEVEDQQDLYRLVTNTTRLRELEENFKKAKPEDWLKDAANVAQHKVNVELLRKLSPSTWCTASGMASHYVENYDNYLLIVNGVTVAGVEAMAQESDLDSLSQEFKAQKQNYIDEQINADLPIDEIIISNFNKKIESPQRKVKEVTSRGNNGVASIDHYDDIYAFFEKHNLDTNNSTLQRAKKAKDAGKVDALDNDFYEDDQQDDFEYDEPNQDDYYEEMGRQHDAERTRVSLFNSIDEVKANIGLAIKHFYELKEEFQNNEEIATAAVESEAHNINQINSALPFYNELVKKAIQKTPYVYNYLSLESQQIPEIKKIYEESLELDADLGDDLPFSKTNTNQIQGYYDAKNDKVVVIASNTPINEAAKVAIHEVAHRGMVRMAKDLGGTKELNQILLNSEYELMKKLPELLKRTGHESLKSLMLDYGFTTESEEGKLKLLSELAARWAETLVNKPKPSWWKDFLTSIQKWITKFTSKILNEKEVNELVGGFVKYGTKVNQTNTESSLQTQQEPEVKPIEPTPKVDKSNQTELFQIEQQKSRLKEKSLVDRANLLLSDYIKANNIKVEFLDKVLSKDGKEVVAKYDSIKRIIQINSNQASALTLPEELAHDLTLALGIDHVLVKRALNLIGRLDYKSILGQQYVDAYKGDVNLLKMELLGKLISKQIADPRLPDELKSENGVKIWETIKNAIKAFISLFKPNSNITSELDNIVSELSDIVISGKEVGNPTMSVEMFDINSTIHDVKKGFPMTNSNNQKLLSREKTFTLRTKNHASGLYKFGKNYYNVLNMYGKAVKADEIKNPDYLKKKFVGEEDVRFDHVKAFFDGTEPLYVYQITKVDDSIQAMLEEQAKSGGIPQDVEKYYVFYTRLISKLKKDVKKINNSLSDESKRIEAKIQEIEATLQNLIYNNNKQNLIDLAHKTIDDVDTYLKKLYALEQSGQDFNVKNMEKSIKVLHTFENLEEVGERARLLISSFKRFGIKLLDEEHLRLTGREITDKEKNEIQKDINYGEFQFGTLSDVRNYLGKTIGLSIKEKQSIIEKNNKESKKILDIEIKKLEDFQKTQGITGKDIYKIFIQEHRGSTVLTKPYTSDYYKLIADSFEKENGAEIRKKLSVYNSKSNNWEPKDSVYYSDNYKEIHKKGNEPLLEFYNFFKKTIADITDKLPVDELDENFIPNIVESTLLSVLKSDKESIGKLKDGVNHIMSANFWSTRENEYFINRELEKDEVPLKYIGNIPSDKKSNDLGYVLLNFMHFGNSYEQMSDVLPKVELFQELMQEKQFIVGGKRNPGSSTNLNNLIDGFIKMQVKGEMKSDNDFLGKAAPIIDFALTYTSLLRIGFSPFAAAANFAVGGTGNIIEAMGGRYFNMANLSEANTIFLAQSFNEDSKLSNIIKKVNPLVEIDDFLNLEEVQKGANSYAKKLKSASYFLQRIGEQKLQVSVMIAIMLNNKVTTKNGDKISMWEAFDENGVWDEKLMGYEFLEIDLNKLTNKVQAVNQGIHGRYSSKDAAIFAQQSLFRAVFQFKKWIPAAIESRFGGKKPSERLGVETEGRYRSYLKGFKYLWANVKGDIKSIEENKFTELDIYSMRKNLTELLIVTVLLLARAGFEDDKLRKKPAYKFTMNLLNQVSGDLLFFYDPIAMEQSFVRIPIQKTLKDFANIFINIPAIFDDGSKSDKKKYHYRSGPSKGENKFSSSVKNFIPGVKPVFDIYRLGNGSPAKK